MIITLDGPAGVGKSTLARRLASALDMAYLDTGAMFRTVALAIFQGGGVPLQEDIEKRLEGFAFSLEGTGESTRLLCNGRPVGNEIRSEEAGLLAARAGKLTCVRDFLKHSQQALGAKFSLVAEGRDMGTVVFPEAACKIFLDARAEVRAARRYLQLKGMGLDADLDDLIRRIQFRDQEDRNRPVAPLRPAPDAILIDTSEMTEDQVYEACLDAVKQAGP